MSRSIFALLVGIDAYKEPVRPLNGCKNDIQAFESFLKARVPNDLLSIRTLLDGQAERQAIINGFRNHLQQASQEDLALFYFSGHGSQEQAPQEFWHVESDRLNETLVCYDSRLPGGHDLADKELALLIREVSDSGAQVVVILDSCHSGNATRAFGVEGIRRATTDQRSRPLDTYLEGSITSLSGSGGSLSGWATPPAGAHLLLAACRSDEFAREKPLDEGPHRGVFSYFILEALAMGGRMPTYKEAFKRVEAQVRSHVLYQTPQLESVQSSLLNEPFFGGMVVDLPPYFTLRNDLHEGWVLDGGSVHGIPRNRGEETTHLIFFEDTATGEDLRDRTKALGTARITEVGPSQSRVQVASDRDQAIDLDKTYKAVISLLPVPRLGVHAIGIEEGVSLLEQEDSGDSPYIKFVAPERAEIIVEALQEHNSGTSFYRIRRVSETHPLTVDVHGHTADSAREVVETLEHIARWLTIYRLRNANSSISDAIQMDVYVQGPEGKKIPVDHHSLDLDYLWQQGQWHKPHFWIKLTNASEQKLYCSFLALTQSFGIHDPGLLSNQEIQPSSTVWAYGGNPIPAAILDKYYQQGVTSYQDTLKLFVSTSSFDSTIGLQDDLEDVIFLVHSVEGGSLNTGYWKPKSSGSKSPAPVMNTLDRAFQYAHTRHVGDDAQDELVDWTTQDLAITIHRPREDAKITSGKTVSLGRVLEILPHSKVQARVRLATEPDASRDVGGRRLPQWLRDDPGFVQPFPLSNYPTRGGASEVNVIELADVHEYESVTSEEPLILRIGTQLDTQEHVLAVGFDPETESYIPLGVGQDDKGATAIRLERLPTPEGTRSLASAIRVYLHKVISKPLGLAFPYPVLSGALPDDMSTFRYEEEPNRVADLVRGADRVLVAVHGIIGDTRSLVGSLLPFAHPGDAEPSLYDLVLAFDYESLNTSIEGNARSLKECLIDVGLGPGHSKTVHIVAHSMGGLISRWMIEREGGSSMIEHLVMAGTPNGGSPWPTVQDWAMAAVGFGLNLLGTAPWPLQALGGLLGLIEKIDHPLDQMKPGSDLLKTLQSSEDPGTRYTSIMGDVTAHDASERIEQRARVAKRVLRKAASTAFLNDPNDVAVGAESMQSLPESWDERVASESVYCDHFTYFRSKSSLEALSGAFSSDNALEPTRYEHLSDFERAVERAMRHSEESVSMELEESSVGSIGARTASLGGSVGTRTEESSPGASPPASSASDASPRQTLVRYPFLEGPSRTPMGHDVSVYAQLLKKAPFPDAPTVAIDASASTQPTLEVVLRTDAFAVQNGSNTRTITVGHSGTTEERFVIRPLRPGTHTVRASYYQHERNLATVYLEVEVYDNEEGEILPVPSSSADTSDVSTRAEVPRTFPMPVTDQPVVPPPALELVVDLDRTRNGFKLHFELNGGSLNYHHAPAGTVELDESPEAQMNAWYHDLSKQARGLRRHVGAAAGAEDTADRPTDSDGELAALGRTLWDQFVPAELKEEYEKFKGQSHSFIITTEDPWIPWEMVKPYRALDQGGYEEDPFWCEQFDLARWVAGWGPPGLLPAQEARAITPRSNLPSVHREASFIKGLEQVWPDTRTLDPLKSKHELLLYLRENTFAIAHFACHGAFQEDQPGRPFIQMDRPFYSSQWPPRFADVETRPIIFMNACHTSRTGYLFTQLGGWASKAIGAGAGAFAGTLWEVRDDLALLFAKAFYRSLREVQPDGNFLSIGTAFRKARDAVKQEAPDNPTWLAYALYADPQGRLESARP